MRNKQIYLRAIAIVQRTNGTPEERAKIRASFALLFWNDPGFKPSEFNAACDAAIAVFPGPREN